MIAQSFQVANFLRSFGDPKYQGFVSWPLSYMDAIARWTESADLLLSQVIPPSTTVPAARSAFMAVLSSLSSGVDGIHMLENAYQAYAVALAPGMAAANYVGFPPPVKPTFVLTGLTTRNAAYELGRMADVLVAWAHTGTAKSNIDNSIITWQ